MRRDDFAPTVPSVYWLHAGSDLGGHDQLPEPRRCGDELLGSPVSRPVELVPQPINSLCRNLGFTGNFFDIYGQEKVGKLMVCKHVLLSGIYV